MQFRRVVAVIGLTASVLGARAAVAQASNASSPRTGQLIINDSVLSRGFLIAALSQPQLGNGEIRDLQVGRVVAQFPAELVPDGARVMGGMTGRLSSVMVFVLKMPVEKANVEIAKRFETAKWTAAKQRTSMSPMSLMSRMTFESGFVTADMMQAEGKQVAMCKGQMFGSATTRARTSKETEAVITVIPNGSPACATAFDIDRTNRGVGGRGDEAQLLAYFNERTRLPTLYTPPGGDLQMSGSSSGPNSISTDAELSVDMSINDVLHHYASQLVASGWKAGDESLTRTIAVQQFARTDTVAEYRVRLLVIQPDTSKRYQMQMRLTRADGARP